jgi:hypothetical protein
MVCTKIKRSLKFDKKAQNVHRQSTLTRGARALARCGAKRFAIYFCGENERGESGFLRQNAKANGKLSYFEIVSPQKLLEACHDHWRRVKMISKVISRICA